MSASQRNLQRVVATWLSRAWRELVRPDPAGRRRLPAAIAAVLGFLRLRSVLAAWSYRVVFTADGRALRRAGEHVLADLRDFCFARPGGRTLFAEDPIETARRIGRREAFDRIINFLNLDESQVQTFMEIDDE